MIHWEAYNFRDVRWRADAVGELGSDFSFITTNGTYRNRWTVTFERVSASEWKQTITDIVTA